MSESRTETSNVREPGCSTPFSCPPTSLIICSRNRPQLLYECVQSILRGNEVPTELIIIDQSDAPSACITNLTASRACEIRYVWTDSVGASRARNAGIAAARQQILAFTDDDVEVSPTWFGLLIQALVGAGPRAVVSGRVLPSAVHEPGGFVPSTKIDDRRAVYVGRIGEDVLYTNNAAMPRSAIEEVGDFDIRLGPGSKFSNAEDNDLGFRLLESGYRIIYEPDAVLYHRAWRNRRDYIPLRWSYGRGQGAYYAKHLSLRDRYMLSRMCVDILHNAFQLPHRFWREPRRAFGNIVYAVAALSGAVQWLTTERRT